MLRTKTVCNNLHINNDCHLFHSTKCLWHWEQDRRSHFFFSPPVHLCRHIYNWNIVACEFKQKTHLISSFCRIGSVLFMSVKTWYCQHYRCEHCVLGNTGLLEDHGINACGTCGVDTSCVDCSGLAHGSHIVDTCGNCLLPEDPTFNTGKNVLDWLASKRCSNGTLAILFLHLA